MKIDLSKLQRFSLGPQGFVYETSKGKFVRFEDVKRLIEESQSYKVPTGDVPQAPMV